MSLPKDVRVNVQHIMTDYCANRVPEHARNQVRVGFQIRGNSVTLIEERPHWQNSSLWIKGVVAQFRYNPKAKRWNLYCADRNSRWHDYRVGPKKDIQILLQEVDKDPTGIFWG